MAKTAKRYTAERQYLLGNLSEDEKIRMEDAFFAEDAKFEEIELSEDELVDAYVRNELTFEEQTQFKAKLIRSPRLLERVKFATALAEKADSFRAQGVSVATHQAPSLAGAPRWWKGFFPQQPALATAMATCVLLILIAGPLLISGWLRLRSESELLASERATLQRQKEELDKQSAEQRAQIAELNAQMQLVRDRQAEDANLIDRSKRPDKPKRVTTQPVTQFASTPERKPIDPSLKEKLKEITNQRFRTLALSLTPGSFVRSEKGSKRTEVLGPEITTVQIRLTLARHDYATYRATVRNSDDELVFQKNLKSQSKSDPRLLISIPARILPPDDYTIEVEGVTASGQAELIVEYPIRLVKEK